MKIVATIMEKLSVLFKPDGVFSRLSPTFEALDTILQAPNIPTKNGPFGRDPMEIKRYMSLVIFALVPSFLASIYFFGYRVLLMILVSYVAGAIVEVSFAIIRKEEINEGFLVTGFIFPLILPPGMPLWAVAVGVAFGIIVGKEIFGGTGRNLFNPALVGRVFLALGYPSMMTSTWIEPGTEVWGRLASPISLRAVDGVSTATPLVAAKGGIIADTLDLLIGRVAGSAGETSAIAILLGGIFLIVVGVASWRTVLSIVISFVGLNALLKGIAPESINPILFNLLSGGFLFATLLILR